ncbi:MAG: FAD-binding oxidoreductase, partial [Pseudomonadota bacterium]
PGSAASTVAVRISGLQLLNPVVMKLQLQPVGDTAIDYRPGQYMSLINPAGTIRSYSVANDYQREGVLEFHIASTAQGVFTNWLFNAARIG